MENDCISLEQYTAKFVANQRITGIDLEVMMHVPCPFCADPDFFVHTILATEAAYRTGSTCKNCGRGARVIFHDNGHGSTTVEFVQTCGEIPPAWMRYRMRRVERPQR